MKKASSYKQYSKHTAFEVKWKNYTVAS